MSQHTPAKVCIGVPVYNGAPYIKDSLEALAAQSYDNFEVIISDNCSTDETESICRSMAERDRRFRYVRQDSNLGLLGNFDFLLKVSDGDYFCWRAHDDLSDENGAVANVVGIQVGVVSGLSNPNDSSVLALKRRPRHEEHYHISC